MELKNRAVISTPVQVEAMAWIPAGFFRMGSSRHYPDEAPVRKVAVEGFWMDRHTITNRQFSEFVEATGHVTLAERDASSMVFGKPRHASDPRNPGNWWSCVPDASWRKPRGPSTSLEGLWDHPVVHVSFGDAQAFADWAGKSLPTEAEWEYAARGGLESAEFVWGDDLKPGGRHLANTWQGEFPWMNLREDGFEGTAPVASYPPNGHGLYDMAGNVWEWTADWYEAHGEAGHPVCAADHPRREGAAPRCKVMKGGSFLCAPNYCMRFRPAARIAQPADTPACHVGFRCVKRPRACG